LKHLLTLTLAAFLLGLVGCGGNPNKDLKPIDPGAKAPKAADKQEGGSRDKATPVQ